MLSRDILLALASAGLISAVPLNINLGAYSPALVVGDGEISFGGAQNAGELMSTLASGAATAGQQAGAAAPAGEGAAQAQSVPPAIAGIAPAAATKPAEGANAAVVETPVTSDILPEGQAATNNAAPSSELAGMISKGMEPSLKIPAPALFPRPNMEKRDLLASGPAAALTSTIRAIEQREVDIAAATAELRLRQRTFGEALNYAIQAAQNQPEIELGTGLEGSGVGIIVSPGKNVPAGSPAAGRPLRGGAPAAAGGERRAKRYVQPGAPAGATAETPKSGITLMAIAEI